jgi:hypothetical protein
MSFEFVRETGMSLKPELTSTLNAVSSESQLLVANEPVYTGSSSLKLAIVRMLQLTSLSQIHVG